MGSYLPDIVPFVPNSVFEFEEIHEGGEKFLDFLDQHRVDVEKTEQLFIDCAGFVEGCWRKILIEIVAEIKSNLKNLNVA